MILAAQSGIPVARIELLDEAQMRACIAYGKLQGYAAAPTLFIELHGSPAGVAEQAAQMLDIVREHGALQVTSASAAEDRARLWQARHDAYYAAMSLRPGCRAWPTDVCVPISRLADCIAETTADIVAAGLLAPIVGHVGDGNFHCQFILDPDDPSEMRAGPGGQQAHGAPGHCHGRHLHRRARRRLRQDRQRRRGGRRGGRR